MTWHFLQPDVAIPQLLFRALAVYAFLVVGLRLAGRREMGQLTTFDLILLLILSNAVQSSINAGDNSLGGGLVSALALLGINWVVGWAAYRWPAFERLVEGRPIVIITDGKLHMRAMRRERISLEELRSALRKQGVEGVTDCRRAVLESDGTLTAIKKGVEIHPLAELIHSDD
jgi:uncharacterized membrane protein YcaP (DUF421 family)